MSEKTEKRQTAAEIRKQIEEATRAEKEKQAELKQSDLPLTGQVAAEINAVGPSIPDVNPNAESKPEPSKTAAEGATATKSVDLKEWAKKKGVDPTTEESALAELRRSDQEFHKRKQKEAMERATMPSYTPQPGYPPPPSYPPNGYSYPTYPPQAPPQIVQEIARTYGFTPEDTERLARFNRDQFETMVRGFQDQQRREIESLRKEGQKNSVFIELSSDPVFRRHDVQSEFKQVLEQMQTSDPKSFEEDPTQYRRAYEMAVFNIGRRNLEGRPIGEGVPPNAIPNALPTNPPPVIGKGSGGGYNESENALDLNEWNKLPPQEKRKWFEERGLVSKY